jgi:hypothetical protein
MITKEKHPLRVLFFRDHEISGLRPAAAPSYDDRKTGTQRSGKALLTCDTLGGPIGGRLADLRGLGSVEAD